MARPPRIDDGDLLKVLVKAFREKGFDGTAIGDLSAVSGLRRASLYHRFPDGKEGMADAVLAEVGARFLWILAPLREDRDVARGVGETARRLGDFYGAGALSCVLDTMTLAGAPDRIREHARSLAKAWIDAMAEAAQRGLTAVSVDCSPSASARQSGSKRRPYMMTRRITVGARGVLPAPCKRRPGQLSSRSGVSTATTLNLD